MNESICKLLAATTDGLLKYFHWPNPLFMKIAECAHPSRYFSVSVAAKIPIFNLFWLPVADNHTILYHAVLSKQDTEQDTKLKSVIFSDIRIPCNVS